MYVLAFFVFVVFPILFILFHLLTKKYLNPFKLIFVFGKKGSGKSTFLVRMALEYMERGWSVYSTLAIPGTIPFDVKQFGEVQFPWKSCVLVDEVGMIWDNRNFKSFKESQRDYFKLQRHYGNVLILASQTFDVDKKIRDLADEMYLITKAFRVFSYGKRILRRTVLVKSTAEAPAKIDEDLEFDSLLLFWAGSRKLTFIPKYAGLFDSFEAPSLPEVPDKPLAIPASLTRHKAYKRILKCKRRSKGLRIVIPYRLQLLWIMIRSKIKSRDE